MREPECYRLVLESIRSSTDKRILTQSDVARLLNKSRGWVRSRLEVGKDGISAEALALKIARNFV